jgi:diguanylate cyclase (GGDEF)-like protein
VFFMDVDGLKDVNDTLGHAAGDELLRAVADRLRALVRPEDTIARLGGDEFTLLCEGVTDLEEARVIASRVIAGVAQPLHVRGIEFEPSLSVGLALVDDPDTPPEAVLREADAAMYAAKEHGGGRLAAGASPLEPIRRRGSNRGRALRQAVEQGELCLHYQPCVSLPDPRIVSLEALVRWQHPRRGLLPPRSFIPLAERNGVIEPLGDWVIRHACRQLAEWHGRVPGAAPLAMAVNVSSRQFASGHLVGTVTRALEETRLDPSRLFLEITETVMLEGSHSVLDQLHALRAMGVRLSVDDFGTGYSSLHYLQRLPLEQLKLDRRFIAGLRLEHPSQAIVASLIRLAHALDLRVVAEGVELPRQRDELADLGCDFAQGWLFGPPGTAAEIEALLRGGLRPATSDPHGDAGPPPAGRLRLVPGPAHAEVAGPVRRRAAHGGPPR